VKTQKKSNNPVKFIDFPGEI